MSGFKDAIIKSAAARAIDDELEPGDDQCLVDALANDPEAAQEFADLLAIDTLLRIEAEETIAGSVPFLDAHELRQHTENDEAFLARIDADIDKAAPPKTPSPLPIFVAIAAAVALTLLIFNKPTAVDIPDVDPAEVATNSKERVQRISIRHLERAPGRFVDFGTATAIVVREHQSQMKSSTANELANGRHELTSGLMEVQYQSGTRLVFEGPASFTLKGFSRLHLHSGKIRARVPLNAVGFQVITPSVTITDLSTEFGAFVKSDDSVYVETFKGLVEVREAATSPATQLPAPNSQWFGNTPVDAPVPTFATAETIQTKNYDDRRQWILDTFDCMAFYDFQPDDGTNRLLNRASLSSDGIEDPQAGHGNIDGATRVQGRWSGKSALQFENDGDQVTLNLPGGLGSFTLSTWLKVDRFDTEYGVILNANGWDPGELHYQVMETGEVNLGIGPTETIRKRFNSSWLYWNSSEYTVATGEWIHLAVVADLPTKSVTHYLNGESVTSKKAPGLRHSRFGHCTIGGWREPEDEQRRPFRGRIDELILIRQALSPEQIIRLAQP